MQKHLIISGLCLLCLLFARCADPFAKEEFVAYDDQPVGLYLETVPEYSDWVKLLKKADLFNAININIKYTCFVANNEAVAAYLRTKNPNWKSVDDLTEEEASNLVKYHIVPGNDYNYLSLSAGKIANSTASGDYLTVTINEDGSRRFVNGIEITNRDMKPINGYVHELAEVLDPIIYTVMQILEQHAEYSIMTQAIKECGLDVYLGRKEITVNNTKLRDYKTIIVANDSTFNANGIYNMNDLKAKFKGDPTDVKSDFYKFVGYHIFNKAYDFADLTTFVLGSHGKNVETYIEREFITVQEDDEGNISINPGVDTINFVSGKYDIPGNNGYIHEVNNIMPVTDPVRYAFVWEPTEWDECRAIPFYRTPKMKSEEATRDIFWFEKNKVEHFRWKTIPDREQAVGYLNYDVDWDRFLYDDCLYAELNAVGWVEFDTPTIMRGKYKIEVVKWAWANPGKWQLYIDEEKFGPVINMARNTEGTLNLGVYRFEDSGSHVFRISVVGTGDNNIAALYIDRFIFTPEN